MFLLFKFKRESIQSWEEFTLRIYVVFFLSVHFFLNEESESLIS